MPKIGNPIERVNLPCDRCGSKRKIAKQWTETIKTDHSTMLVHHTQVICTNKDCQAAFDKLILEESEKIEKRKTAKEASKKPTN